MIISIDVQLHDTEAYLKANTADILRAVQKDMDAEKVDDALAEDPGPYVDESEVNRIKTNILMLFCPISVRIVLNSICVSLPSPTAYLRIGQIIGWGVHWKGSRSNL